MVREHVILLETPDVPVAERFHKQNAETIMFVPQARAEQLADVAVPQAGEQHGEVLQVIPQERFSKRILELTVDIPTLHEQENLHKTPEANLRNTM